MTAKPANASHPAWRVANPPPPTRRVGRYELVDLLGAGAMGTVYRGVDPDLGREVAVKLMSPTVSTDPDLRFRFHREAQTAGSLQHPNIITVYEYGEANALLFIAMEYVSGKDLSDVIAEKAPLDLLAKLGIGLDVLAGLDYAHARGVTHRDIKPGNIRLTGDGRAKIMDFGIAHLAESEITNTGIVLGTPSYMAPELLKGGDPSPATDVFSAGAVLYELLTLRRPFEGETTHAVLYKVLSDDPDPVSELDPTVPRRIHEIVRKAMVKVPEDRYQSAALMAADLKAACIAISTADYSTVVVRPKKRTLKGKAKTLLASVVASGGLFWAANVPSRSLDNLGEATLNPIVAQIPDRQNTVAPDSLLTAVRDQAFDLRFQAQGAGVPIADLAEGDLFVRQADSLRLAGSLSLAIIAFNNAGSKWAEAQDRFDARGEESSPRTPSQPVQADSAGGALDTLALDSTGVDSPPVGSRDDASEIDDLFQRFDAALESHDVEQLRAVYPRLYEGERTEWIAFFEDFEDIRFNMEVRDLRSRGDSATADLRALVSYTDENGRQTATWTFTARLRRTEVGWLFDHLGKLDRVRPNSF